MSACQAIPYTVDAQQARLTQPGTAVTYLNTLPERVDENTCRFELVGVRRHRDDPVVAQQIAAAHAAAADDASARREELRDRLLELRLANAEEPKIKKIVERLEDARRDERYERGAAREAINDRQDFTPLTRSSFVIYSMLGLPSVELGYYTLSDQIKRCWLRLHETDAMHASHIATTLSALGAQPQTGVMAWPSRR